MIIFPSKYVRRQIGDQVFYASQLKSPNLIQLNSDADEILRRITEPTNSIELLKSLGVADFSLAELEEFLTECVQIGALESDQMEKVRRSVVDGEVGSQAAKTLEDYSAENRIPTGGSIEITTRCNLRCCHCYLGEERQASCSLDFTRWSKYLDQAISRGCVWMEITGGDPLLSPVFPDVYRFLVERGVIVTVLTNGTTFTPEVAKLFKSQPPMKVEVSIYGYSPEVYESVTGVPGSHSRFLAGLKCLAETGVNMELKAILLRQNYKELEQMRELADSIGAFFRFGGEIHEELDGTSTPNSYRLSPREVARLDFSDVERAKEIRTFANERCRAKNNDAYQCRAGVNGFHIGSSGIMYPCITERAVGYSLEEHTFDEIWDKFFPERLSLQRETASPCVSCEKHSMCKVCPPRSRMATGNQFAPVPFLCELADERIILAEGGESK